MKISVLICTYNRHELLRKALASILIDSEERPDELVVVNGGSGEADLVMEEFLPLENVAVRWVKTRNVNLATSRNLGLHVCTGDIVAMTDDDAEVFPDWITKIKELHAEFPTAGAIGGQVIGKDDGKVITKVADLVTFPRWESRTPVRSLPGVNISYKLAAINDVGPQDETLARGEDVDFNWRILQTGRLIMFDPSIRVYHTHRPHLRGLINQQYMYGKYYYRVRKKWPEMYSIYPRKVAGLRDILRMVNFFVSVLYEPLQRAQKLQGVLSRLASLLPLFVLSVSWRSGVISEYWRTRFE